MEVAVSEVSLCTERLSSLRAGQHPGRPSKCPCPCMPNAAGACLVKAHILSMHAPQIIRDSPLCVCCVPFSRDDCPAYFSLLSVGPRLCWTSPRPVYFSPTSTRRPNRYSCHLMAPKHSLWTRRWQQEDWPRGSTHRGSSAYIVYRHSISRPLENARHLSCSTICCAGHHT